MCSHRRCALIALRGLLALVLSLHFGLTLIYLLPLNPITLRLAPLLDGYMTPLFTQDWRLFAPNPIDETRVLLLACRLRAAQGTTVETAWVDISTPLWAAQARQRFSPAAWLSRPQTLAIERYFNESEPMTLIQRQQQTPDPPMPHVADALQTAQQARRVLATHVLARLGAAYCDRWYGAGRTVATRMRLAVLRFPRFSRRQLPDSAGETRTYTFDWMPYEQVAPLPGPAA
jgi:hypothetical protein